MLLSTRQRVPSIHLLLASTSPRRKELMNNIGVPFTVLAAPIDEHMPVSDFDSIPQYVEALAMKKAIAAANLVASNNETDKYDIIVSADTVVVFEGKIFGKPSSSEDAINILSKLSGETHSVITGVCLRVRKPSSGDSFITFHEVTTVKMARLERCVIEAYVNSGEPLDKAGAYGIQGLGCSLVERIDGDYFNVVGLPIYKLCKHIHDFLHDVS
ncbi:hypothetical protein CRM22_000638 [Opisthorchis felineus]|uniref:Maf-like protein n=3 Tax=Opisthorchis felineus TaxID=147828 RepID=A0A4S2MKZ9_OPIFE|nr:hypothetical protein CRM22_000638 [Opisthorchis felineus]